MVDIKSSNSVLYGLSETKKTTVVMAEVSHHFSTGPPRQVTLVKIPRRAHSSGGQLLISSKTFSNNGNIVNNN
jgi:hypothetical protein